MQSTQPGLSGWEDNSTLALITRFLNKGLHKRLIARKDRRVYVCKGPKINVSSTDNITLPHVLTQISVPALLRTKENRPVRT